MNLQVPPVWSRKMKGKSDAKLIQTELMDEENLIFS